MPQFPGLLQRFITVCLLYFSALAAEAQPVTANFSGTPLSGCAPLLVQFQDLSTGSPDQWNWDLGNGTFSILQSPSVTYFNPGTYNIKLVVRNSANGNSDSIVKNAYITVYARPVVSFSASDSVGCYPLTTQFTDASSPGSGTITNWQWDFGDGTSSTQPNPVHTYAQGVYTVVLQVRNDKGCAASFTKPNYIHAVNGAKADFTQNTTGACNPPVTVNFTNLSTGSGILSYQWNFGDGNTSTATNPTHTYSAAGSYNVQLIVVSSFGCTDTIVKNSTVSIGVNDAAFTSADSVCVGSPLAFTNTSTPAPQTAVWDFGDGTGSSQINPTKTYTATGTFLVKMVAGFGGCADSAQKTVTVLPKPNAAFTANNTQSCQAPHTVQFNNNSTGGVSYSWNFGDGNTSAAASPSHTYTAEGDYDVSLTVTNAFGCSDSVRLPQLVRIHAPQLAFTNLPDSGCAPLTVLPGVSIITPDVVTSYNWDFGDGATSGSATPIHTYLNPGVYTVTLIVTTSTGCTDTLTAIVKAGSKPNVNFTATPLNACAKDPIQFNDLSTGTPPPNYWYWQFGDGTTSFAQNPAHFYNDTGWFSITLIAGNSGCYDTLHIADYVYINPPIARFNPVTTCASPFTFTFNDQSIAPLTWAWNFGDGNTSTQQSPVHTYNSAGFYTVELTVTNGSCVHTTQQTIRALDITPDFNAFPLQVCKSTQVTFSTFGFPRSDASVYTWNFGDGTVVVGDSTITHAYAQSGTYSVQLIVTDVLGCSDTIVKNQLIRVFGPTAAFTVNAPGTCLNSAVQFTDQSVNDGIHPIGQWIWHYGDGNSDTLTAPPFQHQYGAGGVYTVQLIVTDTTGCADSITKPGYVVVSKPVAGFNSADTLSCPGKTVQFNNTSAGSNLTYQWNFGDGNTSTAASPAHSYTADGVYTVQLIVNDQYGCADTIVLPQYVRIRSARALFVPSDTFGTCPPLFVNFTNQSPYYTSLTWSFGDGATSVETDPSHFYTTPGIFPATLIVSVPGGCSDTLTRIIRLQGPSGTFSYTPNSGCDPLTVNFTASASSTVRYVWDFNNGQTLFSNTPNISYTYNLPGQYLPRVILDDGAGCNIPVLGTDTIFVYGVAAQADAASFLLCDSGLVNFSVTHSGNDPVTGYLWSFGDGGSAVSQNPAHQYTAPGNYTAQCIVTTARGCRDTAIVQTPVRIIQSPLIDITGVNGACVPATVQFAGQMLRPDTSVVSWQWDFGNGQTASVMNPGPVTYNTPGVYSIRCIATNSSGCADTIIKTFTVWVLPVVDAGANQRICRGTPGQLAATGAVNYIWSPANGLSCTNCANPMAAPDTTQFYYVQGTDIHGCVNRDSLQVSVVQPFVMNQSPDRETCSGKPVSMDASGAFSYVWSPPTGLTATTGSRVFAAPNTTTTYRVVGYDQYNCFTDTGFIRVTVYPVPTVNAGPDVTITGGSSVRMPTIVSNDVTAYHWTPGTSLDCYNCKNPVATPNQTTTYRVEVTNNGGCKNSDEITIFVLCGKDNLFIPNTFSPNGDGVNDKLYPRGTGVYTIKSFRIFDRWGELLYEALDFKPNDESKAWNGTYKGRALNPDVYVYMVEVICNNKNIMGFKGNVSLIK